METPFHKPVVCPVLIGRVNELATLHALIDVEESAEQFTFRHALTRRAVYTDLLVRERKTLHRGIADLMEHIYASTLDTRVADLAYHFYEAGAWEQALLYGHMPENRHSVCMPHKPPPSS